MLGLGPQPLSCQPLSHPPLPPPATRTTQHPLLESLRGAEKSKTGLLDELETFNINNKC